MQKLNLTARVGTVAMLALAGLPVAALATNAHAATTVKVADLNLTTSEGQAALNARTNAAVRKFCAGERTLERSLSCRDGVRAEIAEKAEVIRQAQLANQARDFAAR